MHIYGGCVGNATNDDRWVDNTNFGQMDAAAFHDFAMEMGAVLLQLKVFNARPCEPQSEVNF